MIYVFDNICYLINLFLLFYENEIIFVIFVSMWVNGSVYIINVDVRENFCGIFFWKLWNVFVFKFVYCNMMKGNINISCLD